MILFTHTILTHTHARTPTVFGCACASSACARIVESARAHLGAHLGSGGGGVGTLTATMMPLTTHTERTLYALIIGIRIIIARYIQRNPE